MMGCHNIPMMSAIPQGRALLHQCPPISKVRGDSWIKALVDPVCKSAIAIGTGRAIPEERPVVLQRVAQRRQCLRLIERYPSSFFPAVLKLTVTLADLCSTC